MTMLSLQPRLRPAPSYAGLPPTLQPHAVLSLAPPTDRRRSLAMSMAVYALVAGGLFWLGRTRSVQVPILHPVGPEVILDPAPLHPMVVPTHAVAPSKVPDVPTLDRSALTRPNDIPETPVALPTQDLSNDPPSSPVSSQTDTPTTQGGPITLSGDSVRVLHQVDPIYPALAMAAHLQGQVVVRMTIDEHGQPSDVEAISGPQAFQGPALKAARQWRFEPARQDGQPVAATFLLTLNFVLR